MHSVSPLANRPRGPVDGFVEFRVLGDLIDNKRDLFDAGRTIPEGERETARVRMPREGGRLVVRTVVAHRVQVEVRVDGRLGRDRVPPGLVPSCAEGGVLGVLPGIVGSIQAMETIKLILGSGRNLTGRLLLFDALGMKFRELKLRKNPDCPMCGQHRTITKLIDYYEFCGVRGEEAPAPDLKVPEITPRELKARLNRGEDLFILDVREPHEYQICNLGGHLIPLGELPRRVHELDSSREIVAHCRSGKRSAEAVDFLRKAGFRKILNLKGGILAWSDEVDASVPKY